MLQYLNAFHRAVLDVIHTFILTIPKNILFIIAASVTGAYLLFIALPLYWIFGYNGFNEMSEVLNNKEG